MGVKSVFVLVPEVVFSNFGMLKEPLIVEFKKKYEKITIFPIWPSEIQDGCQTLGEKGSTPSDITEITHMV